MCWSGDWQSRYWRVEMAIFSCCFPTSLSRLSLYHSLLFFCCFLFSSPPGYIAILAWLPIRPALPRRTAEGRFQLLANNNLQIHQVTKADEGVYRCEASVEARGEIDFVDIAVVVNGELHVVSLLGIKHWSTPDCRSVLIKNGPKYPIFWYKSYKNVYNTFKLCGQL